MADPIKKFAVPIDMMGLAIRHLATPTAGDDAANKDFVETLAMQARTGAVADVTAQRGLPGGYATLDIDGKLDVGQIPALAITDTQVVASEAAMLGLIAQRGDVAVRTDLNKSFILAGDDPSQVANWVELRASGYVISVDGMTGTVVLSWQSDIGNGVASSFLLEHGMDTRDVQVAVLDAADDFADVECRVTRPSGDAVLVDFGTLVPGVNAFRVVIQR